MMPRIAARGTDRPALALSPVLLLTLLLSACSGASEPPDVSMPEAAPAGVEEATSDENDAAASESGSASDRSVEDVADDASSAEGAALAPPVLAAPEMTESLALAAGEAPDLAALGLPQASDANEGAGYAGAGWLPLGQAGDRALAWSTGPAGPPDLVGPHGLALYVREHEAWQKLDQLSLDERLLPAGEQVGEAGAPAGAFPFFLFEDGVVPVEGADGPEWVVVRGGWGANSGAFLLVQIEADRLRPRYARLEAFPGSTSLLDLDGQDPPELLLDASDGYVFCRACGVVEPGFALLRWDGEAFGPVAMAAPADPEDAGGPDLSAVVEAAEAGLWQLASERLAQALAEPLDAGAPIEQVWTVTRVGLMDEAWDESQAREVSPAGALMHELFRGDYAAILERMRGQGAEALMGPEPALLEAGWEEAMRERIERRSTAALAYAEAHPEWEGAGAAWLLRGWSRWTARPGDATARADLAQAAERLDGDELAAAMRAASE